MLRHFCIQLFVVILMISTGRAIQAQTVGTAFTFQGQLAREGTAVIGDCRFVFTLWNDPIAADPENQIGPTLLFDGQNGNPPLVTVSSGMFTVVLDFGEPAFGSEARWLEIKAACPPDAVLETLSPRQEVRPVPYALALPALRIEQILPADCESGAITSGPNVIGGWQGNRLDGEPSGVTISGGGGIQCIGNLANPLRNTITRDFGTIGGGAGNTINGTFATVAGGRLNNASGDFAAVAGGEGNVASGSHAAIAGGRTNIAGNDWATVAGGIENRATASRATVGGGAENQATADFATIPGGAENIAGGWFSFAAGRRARVRAPAQVSPTDPDGDKGTFVWADASGPEFESTGENQFLIRAAGGVGIGRNNPAHPLHMASGAHVTIAGVWESVSSRQTKQNLKPIRPREILEKVAALPIHTWNYKAEKASIRHLGPTAEDFHAAFGLGGSDKHIGSIDADGVALAAIQGLHQVYKQKDAQIAALQRANRELAERLARIETLVARLAPQPE